MNDRYDKMSFFIKYITIGIVFLALNGSLFSFSSYNLSTEENDTFPIIFLHGMLASGDTYSNFVHYFRQTGYSKEYLHVLDWNTLNRSQSHKQLDLLVSKVIAKTGKKKVILIGHSAGGGLAYQYMNTEGKAERVHRYIHIGSSPQSSLPGKSVVINTLNLYSSSDNVVKGGEIPGAINIELHGLDHYEIATSLESFKIILHFLHSGKPDTVFMVSESDNKSSFHTIGGRVVSMGENNPVSDARIVLYAIDQNNGSVLGLTRDFKSDADGYWGPFTAIQDKQYVFEVHVENEERSIAYYMEPFTRDDDLLYLRIMPAPNTMPGFLLSGLPSDDNQSVLAVYSAGKAMTHGRDAVFLDSIEISTPEIAGEKLTTISIFLYDDGDRVSSGRVHSRFAVVPFLKAMDVFIPVNREQSISTITFNNRTIVIPKKPASEFVQIAVFR